MLAQRLTALRSASLASFRRTWHRSGARIALLSGAVGLLAALAFPRPPVQESFGCGGAVEWTIVELLRLLPGVTVASVLLGFNGVLALVAFGAFGRLLHVASGSVLIALAATLATVWSPAGMPTLAPATGVAALGATSWSLLALRQDRPIGSRRATGAMTAVLGGAALLVLVLPPLVLPVTLIVATCVWSQRRRVSRSGLLVALAGWALATTAAALIAGFSSPPMLAAASGAAGLACAAPRGSAEALAMWPSALPGAVGSVGPLPFALAAAGIAASLWARDWRLIVALAAGALVALVAVDPAATGSLDLLMPLIVPFWGLVATGMRAVRDWTPGRPSRAALAGLLIGLLPLLQLAHRAAAGASSPRLSVPAAQFSTNDFWYLLRALPDAAVVREDRTADLLFRAVAPRLRRGGRMLTIIPADPAAIRQAMRAGPVYALPVRQAELQNLGFVLRAAPPARGVWHVVDSRPCLDLTHGWQRGEELTRVERFALVADRPGARGPVVMLLVGEGPLAPRPRGWPGPTIRGFHPRGLSPGTDPPLRAELLEDGVPTDVLDGPFLQRLVLWRTVGAPLALAVDLRRPPTIVIARLAPEAGDGLRLCPAPALQDPAGP